MEELYLVFRGIVQGVGFRFTTQRLAQRYGIKGWVRNRGDGSVECIAQGSKREILEFLEDLKGEFEGYIRDTEFSWRSPQEIYTNFSIRF